MANVRELPLIVSNRTDPDFDTIESEPIDYSAYDLNNSQGLSAPELERMSDGVLSYYVDSLPMDDWGEDGQLNTDLAHHHLAQLSPHKLARFISGNSSSFVEDLLTKVFEQDPYKALQVILATREPLWNEPVSCLGSAAAAIIPPLPHVEETLLLGIAAVDPEFYESLLHHRTGDGEKACQEEMTAILLGDRSTPIYTPPESHTTLPNVSRLDPHQTIVVPMRGYAISDPYSFDAIATLDVSSCIVLTLHDPMTGVSVLAHVDCHTEIDDSLDMIFQDLREMGLTPQTLEAKIVGSEISFESSQRTVALLKDRLHYEGVIIQQEHFDPIQHAFVLDVATGTLQNYDGPYMESQSTTNIPGYATGSPLTRHPWSSATSLLP
jgi:chemotaxis receptor (MCP) glutamine deamidase CheD